MNALRWIALSGGLFAWLPPTLAADDWPSYNGSLTSQRHSDLDEIDTALVPFLNVRCVFDTGQEVGFQTGLIEVAGTLYGTTEWDTFALDATSCVQRWRVHEEYEPAGPLQVKAGAALADGRLFRGTQDGRVISYDSANGRKAWEARIADPQAATTVAAPVAWNGVVLIGRTGGDHRGVHGSMVALDAASGKRLWETDLLPGNGPQAWAPGWQRSPDVPDARSFTTCTVDPDSGLLYVPGGNPAPVCARSLRPGPMAETGWIRVLDAKTGALRTHYPVVSGDYHEGAVSAAPAILRTRSGRHILAEVPEDGYLHVLDLAAGRQLFKTAVTGVPNAAVPLSRQAVRRCPAVQRGAQWSGPAYDPATNLLYTAAVDWCITVTAQPVHSTRAAAPHSPWSGQAADPGESCGEPNPPSNWAGWVYATDADSGRVAWKYQAAFPILSGITATAGGLVLAGDVGGTLYAFEARSGNVLWSYPTGAAVGGGLITYRAGGQQRIAAALGMTSPLAPTPRTTAKVMVLDLGGGPGGQPHASHRARDRL